MLYKTHQALVDGVETVDLGQVLLDKDPEVKILGVDEWHPHRHPSNAGLLASALHDNLTERDTAVDTARQAVGSALRTADRLASAAGKVVAGLTGRRPDRGNALSGELSQQRRVVGVETSLADYRTIRDAHGGTINDVILATLTGALRAWLMTRSESMGGLRQIQAVVPVSVIDRELEATSLGSQIAPHFVTLPIAEASPVVRLHQVSYSFKAYKETGRAVAANRLAGIAGFAPTTFHAIGSRVAAAEVRRDFQLSITNVPGPQSPLYAAGARMVRTFPIPPLLPGQTLAIGVTSYDGQVFYGITADRDLVPDADVLGQCVTEALAELLDTATGGRPKIPRGPAQEGRPQTVTGSTSRRRSPGWPGSATTVAAGLGGALRRRRRQRGAGVRRPDGRRGRRPPGCSTAPGGGWSWSPTWPTPTAPYRGATWSPSTPTPRTGRPGRIRTRTWLVRRAGDG